MHPVQTTSPAALRACPLQRGKYRRTLCGAAFELPKSSYRSHYRHVRPVPETREIPPSKGDQGGCSSSALCRERLTHGRALRRSPPPHPLLRRVRLPRARCRTGRRRRSLRHRHYRPRHPCGLRRRRSRRTRGRTRISPRNRNQRVARQTRSPHPRLRHPARRR